MCLLNGTFSRGLDFKYFFSVALCEKTILKSREGFLCDSEGCEEQ